MAAGSRSEKEQSMAIRLLDGLEIDTSSNGRDFLRKGEFSRAITFYEMAAQSGKQDSPRKKYIFYDLACAYARILNKTKALEHLKLALEHGYDNIEHIRKDEDLASLRDSKEFQNLIRRNPIK
jgi:tetratricopeptide (TPR) repeat protein